MTVFESHIVMEFTVLKSGAGKSHTINGIRNHKLKQLN